MFTKASLLILSDRISCYHSAIAARAVLNIVETYQQSQYVRRMNVSGSIVVAAKGATATSPQTSYVNVVQNAQNNFSATIARQQEIINQQVKFHAACTRKVSPVSSMYLVDM